MNVYALFSDRSSARIILDVFSRKEGDPLSIRSTVDNASVCKSAERGIFCALSYYKRSVPAASTGHDVVWEFDGNPDGLNNYDGPSAGLAFFIAFLLYLNSLRNAALSFAVAATGELSDLTGQAEVNPVRSLTEKLQAACELLRSGDKIFYPLKNSDQIDSLLLQSLKQKGIELIPVSTVAEAGRIIDSWFSLQPKQLIAKDTVTSRSRRLWRIPALVFGITVVAISALYVIRANRIHEANVLALIEQGEFASVRIDRLSHAVHPALRHFAEQAAIPLHLQSSFIYLENNRPLLQDMATLSIMQNVELDSSEGYRFEVQTDHPCYVYLFQFEGSSNVELLFPASSFDLGNHFLQDHHLYLIPGGINYFYLRAIEVRRMVTIYVLGSFWRALDIEKSCQSYDQAQTAEKKKEYRDRLLRQIQRRLQAIEGGWNGLQVSKGAFWRK